MFRQAILLCVTVLSFVGAHAQMGVTMDRAASSPRSPGKDACMNMETLKEIPCPDSNLFFKTGQSPVQAAFNAQEFGVLNELYAQWCSGRDRFPDGRWKLSQYAEGLSMGFRAWRTWARDLKVIEAWQAAFPDAAAPKYAEAVYWETYAWAARGGGYGRTVSKEGWELFMERLDKAMAALDSPQMAATPCPAPAASRLSLLTARGAVESEFEAVYQNAVAKYPEYHGLYFAMARHLEPRWGGSVEAYDRFANQVTKATQAFEGMGMYARLYWVTDQDSGIPFRNDAWQPPAWSKLKAGFEDLMRRYPNSTHNLGQYLNVACRSSDSDLYRRLRDRIVGYERSAEMMEPMEVCDRRHGWTAKQQN